MAINVDVLGNTQPLEAAVQSAVNRIRRRPIKITVDDKGATQPLGNMRRSADEFSKSMEAANARIIAFGASMAIINGVADAFKGMVRNVVEVEKALADINVVMGLSAQNLERFSDGLFTVAKETGQAFKIAADAATEYARQGLSMEESLKRTKDALILTRLTGMDSANAVKSLTAAMNTYGNQIKDTTQLVSKFAAVDVKFAVSAEDFADAIARTGAAAKGAGVDIDELIGLVTAAQQQTARGGKVIGNSFKTIFTRIGRTDTLNQLENLGIAVRDVEGNTLGAKRILTDLANTFDSLTEAQKAQIAQTVGGVFQINVLKAVLGDDAKQNGILANATQISAGATDEAITKNEQLRQTMAAMATETGLAIKEVSAKIGEIALAPGMEKILNVVKSVAEGANNLLGDGESAGNKFANGFLKGLGNIITGPGLVVIVAVFGKLFLKAAQYARESLASLIGVTTEAQKQKAIQTSLVNLFGQNAALSKEMLRTDISRTEKEKIILALLKAQVAEANVLNAVSKQAASTLYRQGFGANLAPRRGRADGHIPNFAEREQAAKGGYAAGNIREMNMPGQGSVIYNSAEKVKNFAGMKQPAIMPPLSSKAGKNYQQAFGSVHGFDPYAGSGFIPNFVVRAGQKVSKAGKTKVSGVKNIDLSRNAKRLAILFGYGPEGVQNNPYSQQFTSMGPPRYSEARGHNASANSSLTRYVGQKYPRIRKSFGNDLHRLHSSLYAENPNVSVSLPSKAIIPVSSKEVLSAKKMDELGDEKLKGIVRAPMNTAMKDIAKGIGHAFLSGAGVGIDDKISSIFTENSRGTKANDIIGALAEMGVRGALSAVAEKTGSGEGGESGAAFDFTGGHAKKISEFFGKGYAFDAVEMKLRGSSAAGKDGGIPKKVINRLMSHARGYIPNFANPLADAINREKGAGVPVSQIRVGSHQALMNKGNPLGLGVTNTADEPNGLRDVFGANGYVPNYVAQSSDFAPGMTDQSLVNRYNRNVKKLISLFEKGIYSQDTFNKRLSLLNKSSGVLANRQSAVTSKINESIGIRQKLNAGMNRASLSYQRSAVGRLSAGAGRMFGGNAGMMMMMGAPMAAGFLQGDGPGQTGAGASAYAAGGALTGAASGGMMASMIAPMFGPAAPLVIGVGALLGGVKGLIGANEENTKALTEKTAQEASSMAGAMTEALSSPILKSAFDESLSLERVKELSELASAAGKDVISKRDAAIAQAKLDYQQNTQIGGPMLSGPMAPGAGAAVVIGQGMTRDQKIAEAREKVEIAAAQQRKDALLSVTRKIQIGEEFMAKDLIERDKKGNLTLEEKSFDRKSYTEMIDKINVNDAKDRKALEMVLKGQLISSKKTAIKLNDDQKAVVLRVNINRAILAAQQEAKMAQLDIKDSYFQQKSILDYQTKIMGGLMSEEQKARIKLNESLVKNAEARELGERAAQDAMRIGLLNDIKNTQDGGNLEQQLKQVLFSGREAKDVEFAELTLELQKMSAKEILALLEKINSVESVDIIEKRSIELKSQVEILDKQKRISDSQAKTTARANILLGQRKDTLKDINREMDLYLSKIKHEGELRGIRSEIQSARFSAGPSRTMSEIFANDRRLVGERQQGLREDYQKSGRSLIKSAADRMDLSQQERLQVINDPKELKTFQAKRIEDIEKEFIKKGGSSYIETLTQNTKARETELGEFQKESDEYRKYYQKDFQDAQKTQEKELQKLKDLKILQKSLNDAKSEESKNVEKITTELDRQLEITNEKISKEETLQDIKEKEYLRKTGPGAAMEGFSDGMTDMRKEIAMMDYELTKSIPDKLASGLATAMTEAVNGAKSIGDALEDAALNFLSYIQQAMMQKLAMQAVGALGFSQGGVVRKYSSGGNVPAMVTNGEYVMGRQAVKKYGGGFMHSLNARGKVPNYSMGGDTMQEYGMGKIPKYTMGGDTMQEYGVGKIPYMSRGGEPGSALAANFGGADHFASGRKYQSRAMSGFFYSGLAGNVGLQEDTQEFKGILRKREEERRRREMERQAKKAKRRKILGMIGSIATSYVLGSIFSGGSSTGMGSGGGATGDIGGGASITPVSAGGSGVQESLFDISEATLANPFANTNLTLEEAAMIQSNDFSSIGIRSRGGKINKYAAGGMIHGKSGIDQIPAMLSEGEYVIKASSARQMGKPMLDKINAGKFYEGGAVGSEEQKASVSSGLTNNINISVNIDKNGNVQQDSGQTSGDGASSDSDQFAGQKISERIKTEVVSVLMEEKRPGGILSE